MKATEEVKFKVNDVFSFQYNEVERQKRFEPYHCFDGTLIVRKRDDGSLYLEDTYWGSGENKILSPEDAAKRGELKFLCNLEEVDKATKGDENYYDESDFIVMYCHHGYQNRYFLRKGATRSKVKMIETAIRKLR